MHELPLGKGPLVMLVVFAATGLTLHFAPAKKRADLEVWIFAKTHYDSYQRILPEFLERHPDRTVDLQLISGRALFQRLNAAFLSGKGAPDMAEIEISLVGQFFRGPLDEIGFVDLTDLIHRRGWFDRMVQPRFRAWSSRGRIFGLPHDVHPVALAYRADIFQAEGIDPATIETWQDFFRVGRRLTKDLDGDGVIDRYAIQLNDMGVGDLRALLYQNGGDFFDEKGAITLDDERNVEVLAQYVRMIGRPTRIAMTLASGAAFYKATVEGYFCCYLMPDWRTGFFKRDAAGLAGKLRLMPLPAWRKGQRRTTTQGGTMIGIAKSCANQALAVELMEHLYLDPKGLADRYEETGIIPPLVDAWDEPVFDKPDPYFGGQRVGRLYTRLAPHVPALNMNPFTSLASTRLQEAMWQCREWYEAHPTASLDQLKAAARKALKAQVARLKREIARNPFY